MGFAKTGLYGGPLIGQLLLEPVVARTSVTMAILLLGVFALLVGLSRLRRGPVPVPA
jgi:hypothetical protein